jgi:hypothetical protein
MAIEHPDIRYVSYPVRIDGTRTGAPPRYRHYAECGGGHFDMGGGEVVGTPEPATEEQMLKLPACSDCVNKKKARSSYRRASDYELVRGERLCPTCHQVMPITAVCDNCG